MNHFRPSSADTKYESVWKDGEKLKAWLAKEDLSRTISLGKAGKADYYPLFAILLQIRSPHQPLDSEFQWYAEQRDSLIHMDRQLLLDYFSENVMGRYFCMTSMGDLGLGSGNLCHGDIMIIAPGCYTPILIRP